MSSTLRPHAYHPAHSPTTSTSDHTTTPTSPHFSNLPHRQQQHPYGNPSAADRFQSTSTIASRSSPHNQHQRALTPQLLQPPPGQSFAAFLRGWRHDDVAEYLTLHKCGHHADLFRRNDIDGRVLLDLDMASLKDMGIAKVGDRVKLLNGIKDLRKRVADANSGRDALGRSGVELRLNGAATPSPDLLLPRSQPSSVQRPSHERSFSHSGSQSGSSLGDRRVLDRSLSSRRGGNTRPPPLDLQGQSSRSHTPSHSYSETSDGSRSLATYTEVAPISAATQRGIAPRPVPPPQQASQQRPSISSQSSSSATVTPASLASRAPSNLNLRAPPARDLGRRSPSPNSGDSAPFTDRPLPPAPGLGVSSSSQASEYARQHAAAFNAPSWSQSGSYGLPKAPAPSLAERRAGAPPAVSSIRSESADTHRKSPSSGAHGINIAPSKQGSPIKAKFTQMAGRQAPIHPFAAGRDMKEISPPKEPSFPPPRTHSSAGHHQDNHTGSLRNQTGGFTVGSAPIKAGSVPAPARNNSTSSNSGSTQSGGANGPMSLEDLRRQLVKFTNSEDGTTRTVNVSSCTSGVEVLERVLKKFGKWNTGNVSTDGESDEDGERLEVDGWGVYTDISEPNAKPLSEAALLGLCLSHREGAAARERGLILRRSKKFGNRKNMSDWFGEQPPPPLSPTSPTYFAGPRLGITQIHEQDPNLLTPSRNKRPHRASVISVMSGLGVPVGDLPPSPSTATRSPRSANIIQTNRQKMYNFFGHRPPSELISTHLHEYFPSAKRKELDKTARKSVHYGGRRGSVAPSVMSGHESMDIPLPLPAKEERAKPSPPRRLGSNRTTMASPPSAAAIPEEGEHDDSPLGGGLPRMSVSDDTGSIHRPRIDGESGHSKSSDKPPLLPPFEPSKESLSDQLQAFSPTPTRTTHNPARPKSISLARRNSGGSTRSRVSYLSQLRRSRDKSDTASMLTVDEITAEVENRRASTITFDDDSDEEIGVVGQAVLAPPAAGGVAPEDPGEGDSEGADVESSDEESEESSEESEDEEDDEEDDEDEDEDDGKDEHGKAYTSTGSGRIIKWIKGALIGAGSFGSVYLGMDAQKGLLMAVKQVDLGSGKNVERKRGMIEALEREIELLKELQHENIVQYLDSSTDDTHLNIFLEYVPGGSIAALLNNYGAFEEALVRNFVRQILTGLNYLHSREIIHRDIKGANILVDNKGGIKISDFGISKKVESNLLQSIGASRPSLQGSVFWMAPEIVKQTSYTSKADIWSVGCLIVEMLTGSHPWADLTQMQAIFRIGQAVCPSTPSDISPEAADLLHVTFEIDHTKRPTAAELLDHAFLAARPKTVFISEAQAKASMAAAHAGAQKGMAAMVGVKS